MHIIYCFSHFDISSQLHFFAFVCQYMRDEVKRHVKKGEGVNNCISIANYCNLLRSIAGNFCSRIVLRTVLDDPLPKFHQFSFKISQSLHTVMVITFFLEASVLCTDCTCVIASITHFFLSMARKVCALISIYKNKMRFKMHH